MPIIPILSYLSPILYSSHSPILWRKSSPELNVVGGGLGHIIGKLRFPHLCGFWPRDITSYCAIWHQAYRWSLDVGKRTWKWASQVSFQHVILTSHSHVHVRVNVYLNLPNTHCIILLVSVSTNEIQCNLLAWNGIDISFSCYLLYLIISVLALLLSTQKSLHLLQVSDFEISCCFWLNKAVTGVIYGLGNEPKVTYNWRNRLYHTGMSHSHKALRWPVVSKCMRKKLFHSILGIWCLCFLKQGQGSKLKVWGTLDEFWFLLTLRTTKPWVYYNVAGCISWRPY